ncbi:MAG: hypothetical protein EPO30_01810 [Lysobacteraceae bacterium]|nr:MAG: hypothetical protein EPO30_01810 [Xanthomonadaceae bacterium]
MPGTFVQKISKTVGLGVLKDCPPPPAVQLRRYNLIYGFNASGKTTLSRVFASLGKGVLSPKLPVGAAFEIELSDGTKIKSGGDLGLLTKRLLVFNGDFQDENLRWKDGTASPVFYIGREQADLAQKLGEVEKAKSEKELSLRVAEEKTRGAEGSQATFKRNTARLIAEQLGLGRKYDATKLAADYDSNSDFSLLSAEKVEGLKQQISQQEALPKVDPLPNTKVGIEKLGADSRELLETTLGKVALADLAGHDGMLSWIRAGLTYHEANSLESCLLCGNDLTQSRKEALASAIDNRFDRLIADLAFCESDCESKVRLVQALLAKIPSPNDVSPENRGAFEVHAKSLRVSLEKVPPILEELRNLLAAKRAHPNQAMAIPENVAAPSLAAIESDVQKAIDGVNAVLGAHNQVFDEFEERKREAADRLKEHYLGSANEEYRAHERTVVQARTAVLDLRTEVARFSAEVVELNKKIRAHGPAASVITAMIQSYLGHKELSIVAVDSGYQLVRNGSVVKDSLSEGEKTAISLCYFLSTLEAEGRSKKDLIVVIDDPISSLDTRALNYAFAIIKSALGEPCQLILLTHNVNFMNEAKKWLRNRADATKGDPTASLLFLDAIRSENGARTTILTELPKYIRDYESEYHYLFHMILRFSRAKPEDREGYFVMPNALRKVLDVFLAFKHPGANGLSSKVEAIPAHDLGIDPARIAALDRLAQVESHADSLDDLIAFSSMTMEEVVAATEALLELMEKYDQEHFKRICKICA